MKFLVLSDIHGDVTTVEKLVNNLQVENLLKDIDGVLISGDIGNVPIIIPLPTKNKKEYKNFIKNRKEVSEEILRQTKIRFKDELKTQLYYEDYYVEILPPKIRTKEELKNYLLKNVYREKNVESVKNILKILSKIQKPIFAIIGNDDHIETEKIFEDFGIKNIHCKPVEFNGITLIGYRGAIEKDIKSLTNYTDEEATKDLQNISQLIEQPFIFLSHCPPLGILDFATYHGTRHIGSRAIRKFIEEASPLVCICGHVHREGGRKQMLNKTLVVNVACLSKMKYRKMGERFGILTINLSTNFVNFNFFKVRERGQKTLEFFK